VDFWDITRRLVQRWYFTLPLLILTGAISLYLVQTVKPDYQLTSHLILTPAPSGDGSDQSKAILATNPWNTLGSTALAESSELAVVNDSVAKTLEARGLSSSYTVTLDQFSPIVIVETVGSTQAQAQATANALVTMLQTSVRDLQKNQGAADQSLMTLNRIPGDKLEKTQAKLKRVLIAVILAGVLLSCGITLAIDAVIRRRQRQRTLGDDPFGDLPAADPVRTLRPVSAPPVTVQIQLPGALTAPEPRPLRLIGPVSPGPAMDDNATIALPLSLGQSYHEKR
jgi:capsular polysaccharide biosynthesis protein